MEGGGEQGDDINYVPKYTKSPVAFKYMKYSYQGPYDDKKKGFDDKKKLNYELIVRVKVDCFGDSNAEGEPKKQ